MQDKTMIKISLVLVILGLPLLAGLSFIYAPEQDNTALYTDQELIHINGTLKDIQNKGTTTRAVLQTCAEIPIILFDPIRLDEMRVSIIAKKEYYNKKLQLVVDELEYV